VRRRSGLLKFRILFYHEYVQNVIAGSSVSRSFNPGEPLTLEDIRFSVSEVLRNFVNAIASGESGSDPAQAPEDEKIREENEDERPAESMLQNCAVEYYSHEMARLGVPPPDTKAMPPRIRVLLGLQPVSWDVLDHMEPRLGTGNLNCAIQGVCSVLGVDYTSRLFRRLPLPHDPSQLFTVDQVLDCLPPHLQGTGGSYAVLNDECTAVLAHRVVGQRQFAPGTPWLLGWRQHLFLGEIQREVPKLSAVKKEEEVHDFRIICYDFETRAQRHDNVLNKNNKLTGSNLVPCCASFAYQCDLDNKYKKHTSVLDPQEFLNDYCREEAMIKSALEKDEYLKKIRLTPGAKRRALFLSAMDTCRMVSLKAKNLNFQGEFENLLRRTAPRIKKGKITVPSQYRIALNRKNTLRGLANVRRVVFNKAYETSPSLPHFKMLLCLAQLPYALRMKEKNGYVSLYAHNAQAFDAYFLLNALTHLWRASIVASIDSIVMKPGRIMLITWEFASGARYAAQCSYAHLCDSLKGLCKSFGLPPAFSKLDTVTLPDGVTMGSMELCLMQPELDPCEYMQMLADKGYLESYKQYCEFDCLALLQVIQKSRDYYAVILNAAPEEPLALECQKIFRKCLSASSVSMRLFKLHLKMNNPSLYERWIKLETETTEEEWVHTKKAVVGGISLANLRGLHLEEIVALDFRSQYPAALMKGLFTLGPFERLCHTDGVHRSYVKRGKRYYDHASGQRLKHRRDVRYFEGRRCFFGPGIYCVTGSFVAIDPEDQYWFRSHPIRGQGNLNWKGEDFSEDVQHIGWIDLNRLLELGELQQFTIWNDSLVAGPECEQVSGAELFAPYLELMMAGKDKAEREGNTGLRTLYKMLSNGLSGKLQMGIHHQDVKPEPNAEIGYCSSVACVSYMKSPVRAAVEFLGLVRNELFEPFDTVGRRNIVAAETDSMYLKASLVSKLDRFIGDRVGDLVMELEKTTWGIVIAPKTYFWKGSFGGKKVLKMAAKGLPRNRMNESLYNDMYLGHKITVQMGMLTRKPKTLAIIDQQHVTRSLKQTEGQYYPLFVEEYEHDIYNK